jgi:exodeoxyribonuclease V alpha subunit
VTLLDRLRAAELIGALDRELARTLGELAGGCSEQVGLAVALASRFTREGHVCFEVERYAGQRLVDAEGREFPDALPELAIWKTELRNSPLVADSDSDEPRPLVLSAAGRLYLRRYWQHEQRVAELLKQQRGLAARPLAASIRDAANRYFTASSDREPDWQRIAAQVALVSRMTVISGGPGTGKTSTVVRLLALVMENALALGEAPPKTLLLAPTGKAAARLVESIRGARSALDCSEEVRGSIPTEAYTLHRALGSLPGVRTRFRHGADNPLRATVIVVDETSMIDLALMRRFLEAVPETALLVFLGDAEQLASVEAGTVLGDIVGPGVGEAHSRALAERVAEVFGERLPGEPAQEAPALSDSIVRLRRSYRFRSDSGIGVLARAIQSGEAETVLDCLRGARFPDVRLVEAASGGGLGTAFVKTVVEGFAPYLDAPDTQAALVAFERFRVLAAHRKGPLGVEGLNERIERALAEARKLSPQGRFYRGRPLLITENDYGVQLYNGDVGLLLEDPQTRTLRAFFRDPTGRVRSFAPSRLPTHETVFAMSIHKSQGSEFKHVAAVLPDERSPLATRELFYTAVTRAKERLTLFATEAALRVSVSRRVDRASGLRDLLWS